MSLAASFFLEIEQMDAKRTFLHGDFEEEIYMKHPKCFTVEGKSSWFASPKSLSTV